MFRLYERSEVVAKKKKVKTKPTKTRVLWDRPPIPYVKESKKHYDRKEDKKKAEREAKDID